MPVGESELRTLSRLDRRQIEALLSLAEELSHRQFRVLLSVARNAAQWATTATDIAEGAGLTNKRHANLALVELEEVHQLIRRRWPRGRSLYDSTARFFVELHWDRKDPAGRIEKIPPAGSKRSRRQDRKDPAGRIEKIPVLY